MKEKAVQLLKKGYAMYEISEVTGLSNTEILEALKEIDPKYFDALQILEHEREQLSGLDKFHNLDESSTKHR